MSEITPLLSFTVRGTAVPQGSKKAWYNAKTKRVHMTEAQGDRLHNWRTDVMMAARDAREASTKVDAFPLEGAVAVRLTFNTLRPSSHYGSGKNAHALKPSAPKHNIKMPDIDKLTRAIFDALTVAGIWLDDAQVVTTAQRKQYVDRFTGEEGCKVDVSVLS